MDKTRQFLTILALVAGCGAQAPGVDEAPRAGTQGPLSTTPATEAEEDDADLRLSTYAIYFAQVCREDDRERVLTLSNVGGGPLRVTSLDISGTGFSLANRPELPLRLNPGRRYSLRVRFDPSDARLTPFEGTLRIRSNDPDEPSIDVPLFALSLPGTLQITPRRLEFGTLSDRRSRTRDLTLRNSGECEVALGSVRITGRLAETVQVDQLPRRVDPGEVETIGVRFRCDGQDDDLDAMIRFIDRAGRSVGSAQLLGRCED